jgi:DNA replication protein DnaC
MDRMAARKLPAPTAPAHLLKNYRQFAADAARNNLDHTRFLLALAEQEVHQREHNMIQTRVKAARFPVLKELADFDFSGPNPEQSRDPGSDPR